MTALELGIFKGHTTAVLASIFGQVISADVMWEFLNISARRNEQWGNVAYVEMDTYATHWRLIGANRVDVVVIDADHQYPKVRNDVVQSWHAFRHLRWFVFDDTFDPEVMRAVRGLQLSRTLGRCYGIGRGSDWSSWEYAGRTWSEPEGLVCARGPASPEWVPMFVEVAYLFYKVPTDPLVHASGTVSFKAGGVLWTDMWGSGTWQLGDGIKGKEGVRSTLMFNLPGLEPEVPEPVFYNAEFNAGQGTFHCEPAESYRGSNWFGIRADKIRHLVKIENERFN